MRTRLNQLDSKLLNENKDFKEFRYEFNMGQKRKFDMMTSFETPFFSKINESISECVGFDLNTLDLNTLTLKKYEKVTPSKIQEEKEFFEINKSIIDYGFGKVDHITLTIPDFVYYADRLYNNQKVDENILDIYNKSEDYQLKDQVNYLMESINDIVNNRDSSSGRLLIDIDPYENIYVDGKPLSSLLDNSKLESTEKCNKYSSILYNSIIAGKPIEVARSYQEGKIFKTEIVPIEFKVSKNIGKKIMDERVKKTHSTFRRLFDWGPFKIKREDTLKKSFDNLSKNKDERHKEILEDRNEVVLPKVNVKKKLELLPNKSLEEILVIPSKKITQNFDINRELTNRQIELDIDDQTDSKHHEKAHRNNQQIVDDFTSDKEREEFLKKQKKDKENKLKLVESRLINFLGESMPKLSRELAIEDRVNTLIEVVKNLSKEEYNELQKEWLKNHPTISDFKPRDYDIVEKYLDVMKKGIGDENAFKIERQKVNEREEKEALEVSENYLKSELSKENELGKKMDYTLSDEYQDKINEAKDKLVQELKNNNPTIGSKEIDEKSRLVFKEFNQINFDNAEELNNTNTFKELADVADRRFIIKNMINKVDPSISPTKVIDIIQSIGFDKEALDEEISTMQEVLKKIDKGEKINISDFETDEISIEGSKNDEFNTTDYLDEKNRIDDTEKVINK